MAETTSLSQCRKNCPLPHSEDCKRKCDTSSSFLPTSSEPPPRTDAVHSPAQVTSSDGLPVYTSPSLDAGVPGFIFSPTIHPIGSSSLLLYTSASPIPSTAATTSFVTVPTTDAASLPTPKQSSAIVNHGLDGRKIAAILVPILVLLALLPILYLCYLRRRSKRDQRALPELHFPQETQLLESRHNSISLTSPFSDNERIRNNSSGMYDRPSTEVSRAPSPVLPSPSIPTFHVRESWPLSSSKALPDPPPAYNPHSSNLRPPSSIHSRVSSMSRSSSFTGMDTAMQNPFTNRESDNVSELSFDHASRGRRTRDLDELSMVSAVESEDSEERDPRHLI